MWRLENAVLAGHIRDVDEPIFPEAHDAIKNHRALTVDLLYGDHEGGQRVIGRFTLTPGEDGSWSAAVSHHRNLDRADPR